MSIKPILDIDIDPEKKLDAYVKRYQEYEAALKKTPEVWAKAGDAAEASTSAFEKGVAALLAMLDSAQKVAGANEKAEKTTRKTESHWERMAKSSKSFATNVGNAASRIVQLAKWSGLVTAGMGLVGYGGLMGLDRLSATVSAGRRSATGLGVSYGFQKAFNTDLSRLVDTGSFLGGVNESLSDVTKRRYLYSAGLTPGQINGQGTEQVSMALLQSVKDLADKTNPAMLGNLVQNRGLSQFGLDLEAVKRLRATPQSELAEFLSQLKKDKSTFGFDDQTQKKWQELNRALTASKTTIEGALVKGLAPLVPQLTKLSGTIAIAITDFLGSKDVKDGLKGLSDYLGSPKFKTDMNDLVTSISAMAKGLAGVAKSFGSHATQDTIFGAIAGFILGGPAGAAVGIMAGNFVGTMRDGVIVQTPGEWKPSKPGFWAQDPNNPHDKGHWVPGQKGSWVPPSPVEHPERNPDRSASWDPGSWFSKSGGLSSPGALFGPNVSNPGNLRDQMGGYKKFESAEGGILGIDNQLRRYATQAKWGKVSTLAEMLNLYAPPSENDTKGYIDFVSKRAGVDPNKPLDFDNKAVMGRVISAMTKMENNKTNYSAQEVERILRGGSLSRDEAAEASGQRRGNSTVTHKVKSDVKVQVSVTAQPGSNPVLNASTLSTPR